MPKRRKAKRWPPIKTSINDLLVVNLADLADLVDLMEDDQISPIRDSRVTLGTT
jgi:hypothetical protein